MSDSGMLISLTFIAAAKTGLFMKLGDLALKIGGKCHGNTDLEVKNPGHDPGCRAK